MLPGVDAQYSAVSECPISSETQPGISRPSASRRNRRWDRSTRRNVRNDERQQGQNRSSGSIDAWTGLVSDDLGRPRGKRRHVNGTGVQVFYVIALSDGQRTKNKIGATRSARQLKTATLAFSPSVTRANQHTPPPPPDAPCELAAHAELCVICPSRYS